VKIINKLLPGVIKMLIEKKHYDQIFSESEYFECVRMMVSNGVILYYFLDYHYDFDTVQDCLNEYMRTISC